MFDNAHCKAGRLKRVLFLESRQRLHRCDPLAMRVNEFGVELVLGQSRPDVCPSLFDGSLQNFGATLLLLRDVVAARLAQQPVDTPSAASRGDGWPCGN